MTNFDTWPTVLTTDGKERITAFLARHGGTGKGIEAEGDKDGHTRGWSEVYAADGYILRCEWRAVGSETQMTFVERSPQTVA